MYPFDLQAGTPRSFEELEADLLRGQKLQGVLTSNEVQVCPCDLPCPGHSPLHPPPCCPPVSLTSGALARGAALAACCTQEILRARGWEETYPLFTTVNRIIAGHCPPSDIVNFTEVSMWRMGVHC